MLLPLLKACTVITELALGSAVLHTLVYEDGLLKAGAKIVFIPFTPLNPILPVPLTLAQTVYKSLAGIDTETVGVAQYPGLKSITFAEFLSCGISYLQPQDGVEAHGFS